jgi:hypothetical protein
MRLRRTSPDARCGLLGYLELSAEGGVNAARRDGLGSRAWAGWSSSTANRFRLHPGRK